MDPNPLTFLPPFGLPLGGPFPPLPPPHPPLPPPPPPLSPRLEDPPVMELPNPLLRPGIIVWKNMTTKFRIPQKKFINRFIRGGVSRTAPFLAM